MGLAEGCALARDVAKDEVLAYADVELPEGRLADRLRAEQDETFASAAAWRSGLPDLPRARASRPRVVEDLVP